MPSLGISNVVDCPDPDNPVQMNIDDCLACDYCKRIDEFNESLECGFGEDE
jgi:hypothetical protein